MCPWIGPMARVVGLPASTDGCHAPGRHRFGVGLRFGEHRFLPALEHREPGERQLLRRHHPGLARARPARGRVRARPRRRRSPPPTSPRAADASAAARIPGTSSGRVASSTPTGSTSRNDGSAPVRSSNRASSTPGTIRGRADAVASLDAVEGFGLGRDVGRGRLVGRRMPARRPGLRGVRLAHEPRAPGRGGARVLWPVGACRRRGRGSRRRVPVRDLPTTPRSSPRR